MLDRITTGMIIFAVALASMAVGCRDIHPGDRSLIYADERSVRTLKRIAYLRGLDARAPVAVRKHGDAAFFAALERIAKKRWRYSPFEAESSRILFGLLHAAPDEAEAKRLFEEKAAAVYDPFDQAVIVRETRGMEGTSISERVLAHELLHALQQQHFGLPDYTKLAGVDQALAMKALYEGDAMWVGTAAETLRSGFFWKGVMDKLARIVQQKPFDVAIPSSVFAVDPGESPALDQIVMMYFYAYGLAFVHELYIRGGFDLMNAAYAHPPRTTEQVLHPQKYILGEEALDVDAPVPPDGLSPVAGGSLGELLIRSVLTVCVGWKKACEVAGGWGGDRYLIVADDQRRVALLWTTAWDTEEGALRFERTIGAMRACWTAKPLKVSGWSLMGTEVLVRRVGHLVGLTRGLPPEIAGPYLEALSADGFHMLPASPPPVPPGR